MHFLISSLFSNTWRSNVQKWDNLAWTGLSAVYLLNWYYSRLFMVYLFVLGFRPNIFDCFGRSSHENDSTDKPHLSAFETLHSLASFQLEAR